MLAQCSFTSRFRSSGVSTAPPSTSSSLHSVSMLHYPSSVSSSRSSNGALLDSRQPHLGYAVQGHRRQYMKYSPIKLLPAQVLCRIFALVAERSAHDRNWSWLTVTHVCSVWRSAALAYPPIWGNIDFTHPTLTQLTLKRAKNLPLMIRTVVESSNVKKLIKIFHTSSSIQEIDIVSSLHGFQALSEGFTHQHLKLRKLKVVVLGHRDNRDIVHYKVATKEKQNGSLPEMTTLELHRCPFNLVSSRYVALQDMSLYYLPRSERPEFGDFLQTLSRYPQLENLTLVNAFHRPMPSGTILGRCIRLSKLKTITLQGGLVEITQLLNHLILPTTIRIKIVIEHTGTTYTSEGSEGPSPANSSSPDNDLLQYDSWSTIRHLARFLREHLQAGYSSRPLEKLVLTGREESARFSSPSSHIINPTFRQSMRIRGYRFDTGWENAALDLSLALVGKPCEDELLVGWLSTIWRALPLGQVRTLALQNVDVVTQKNWMKYLQVLPPAMIGTEEHERVVDEKGLRNVEVLEIDGHPPSGLAWALLMNAKAAIDQLDHSCPGDDADDADRVSLFLPTLKDVYLYDVDCFQGGYMTSSASFTNSHQDLDDSQFLDVFAHYLSLRTEYFDRQVQIRFSTASYSTFSPGTSPSGSHMSIGSYKSRFSTGKQTIPMGANRHLPKAIRTLHLFQCQNVRPGLLASLSDSVRHVNWDRRGGVDDDEVMEVMRGTAVYRNQALLPPPPPQLPYYQRQSQKTRASGAAPSPRATGRSASQSPVRSLPPPGPPPAPVRHFQRLDALRSL